MQLLYHISMFAVLASTLSSAAKQNPNAPKQIGKDGALMTAGQCQIGQHYCFGAIIGNLSMSHLNCILPSLFSNTCPYLTVSTDTPQKWPNKTFLASTATRSTKATGRAATDTRDTWLCLIAGTDRERGRACLNVRDQRHTSGLGGARARARYVLEELVIG